MRPGGRVVTTIRRRMRLGSKSYRQAIESEINDRRRVQRQELADQQSADDRNTERPPQLRSRPSTEGQRDAGKKSRHRGHHDRAEAEQAGLINRLSWNLSFSTLRIQSEVDHHDSVFLHNADEEDDSDQRD